jgi:large subunit ribosomal protein L31
MKSDIHPKWYPDASFICACGETFAVGSTRESVKIEVCSKCHPFYSGDDSRIIDTEGRVERLKRKYNLA